MAPFRIINKGGELDILDIGGINQGQIVFTATVNNVLVLDATKQFNFMSPEKRVVFNLNTFLLELQDSPTSQPYAFTGTPNDLLSIVNNTYLAPQASQKIGFLDYGHNGPSVSLVANTWTDVPNNGAGGSTNKLYPPNGVTEVLDPNTGYLDFSQLSLGSQLLTRTHIKVTPTTNKALLQVRYLLGQGAGQYSLLFWSERLDSGSGQPYERVIPFPVYMGDLNTQGGQGKLQVKLSTSGTLDNVGSYIQILLR